MSFAVGTMHYGAIVCHFGKNVKEEKPLYQRKVDRLLKIGCCPPIPPPRKSVAYRTKWKPRKNVYWAHVTVFVSGIKRGYVRESDLGSYDEFQKDVCEEHKPSTDYIGGPDESWTVEGEE